jgi:hypothetical protein
MVQNGSERIIAKGAKTHQKWLPGTRIHDAEGRSAGSTKDEKRNMIREDMIGSDISKTQQRWLPGARGER